MEVSVVCICTGSFQFKFNFSMIVINFLTIVYAYSENLYIVLMFYRTFNLKHACTHWYTAN